LIKGLKAAITRVVGAAWQRCHVHFMRNALTHVPKGPNTVVATAIRQVLQPDHAAATQTWRHVSDQLGARWPKLGAYMDAAEHDVLAYMTFPEQDRVKLHSTNPLERLNKEVKRRADSSASPRRGQHHPPHRRLAPRAERRIPS
jgi:putative transposase